MHFLKDLTQRFSGIFSGILLIIALLTTTQAFGDDNDPKVVNLNTGITYTDLQTAINDAYVGNTLKVEGTFVGNFTISKSLILKGHKDAVLDGNQTGGTLVIGNEGLITVQISNITIQNGKTDYGAGIYNYSNLTLSNVEVINNTATINGGGIYNEGGGCAIFECIIAGNSAPVGGGIYNEGPVSIFKSAIYQNSASEVGGGIYSTQAQVYIEKTEIDSNAAIYGGGGLYLVNVVNYFTVLDSSFSNNIANELGGGLYLDVSTTASFTNVKIKGNSTSVEGGAGGGIANYGSGVINFDDTYIHKNTSTYGGGIYTEAGTVNFTASKIAHNTALSDGDGGGIYLYPPVYLYLAVTEVEHNSPDNIAYD